MNSKISTPLRAALEEFWTSTPTPSIRISKPQVQNYKKGLRYNNLTSLRGTS